MLQHLKFCFQATTAFEESTVYKTVELITAGNLQNEFSRSLEPFIEW
jgi:hypothetical protein